MSGTVVCSVRAVVERVEPQYFHLSRQLECRIVATLPRAKTPVARTDNRVFLQVPKDADIQIGNEIVIQLLVGSNLREPRAVCLFDGYGRVYAASDSYLSFSIGGLLARFPTVPVTRRIAGDDIIRMTIERLHPLSPSASSTSSSSSSSSSLSLSSYSPSSPSLSSPPSATPGETKAPTGAELSLDPRWQVVKAICPKCHVRTTKDPMLQSRRAGDEGQDAIWDCTNPDCLEKNWRGKTR